jgi:SpoVK/Ycf46/Vps4 family AAA+-type ATPase
VSASQPDGTIKMVDIEVISELEDSDLSKYEIIPGAFRVTPQHGLQKLDLLDEVYFETSTTKFLMKRFNAFCNKQHKYEEWGRIKKRSFLLGSIPGVGKSALIRYFCRSIMTRSDVCIMKVESDDVSWETMTKMFIRARPTEVKLIVLVVEDIGGTYLQERSTNVGSDLLNFLDGNTDCFKIPTLIIGTTNYLNILGPILNDRPGRCDFVMQVEPPSDDEITTIVENFIKRPMVASEKKALYGKFFTPAHCIEAIVRSELDDIDIEEAAKELLIQRKHAKESNFEKGCGNAGFGRSFDERI